MIQKELAGKVGYTDAWLSNLETGQLRPRPEQVEALEEALGLPSGALMIVYRQLDNESLPGWFRPWIEEEQRASVLRGHELALVPGLLQTEAYARAVLNGDEEAVATRMKRQEILKREVPPTLRLVLDEAVLHRRHAEPSVMREQLEYLITCVAPPRLTVQVIRSADNPYSVGAFTIATVDGGEIGYVETAIRGIVTSSRADITDLLAAWELIRTYALPQKESIELIQEMIEGQWT
jgi:transcriptional regulator with XRE-family HTH domain